MDNTIAEGAFGSTSAIEPLVASMRLGGNLLDPNRPNSENSPRSPAFLRSPGILGKKLLNNEISGTKARNGLNQAK